MENNEFMNEGMEIIEMAAEDNNVGIGTGKAMLIGAGLVLAIGAGIKLGKTVYEKYKAKKHVQKDDRQYIIDEEDIERVVAK